MVGAVLPWLSVYAGLKTYSGLAGLNGRLLLGGGVLGLLGGLWCLRVRGQALQWALGLWGFVLLAFTGWLLVQLLTAYRGLAADPFFLARLGPGVPVATVGAATLAGTLLVSPAGPPGVAPPPAVPARLLATGLAWLSAGAATIHFAVLGPHLRESWILGAFFAMGGFRALLAVAPIALASGLGQSILRIALFSSGIVASMLAYGLLSGSLLQRLENAQGAMGRIWIHASGYAVGVFSVVAGLLTLHEHLG